jgi:ribosome-binding factor A
MREIMKRNRASKDDLSAYRGDVDADDGLDPRYFFQKENRSRGAGRKAQQLCAQIAETLSQVFCESGDAIVQSLQVVEIKPAPDASQFLVLVAPAVGACLSTDEATEALMRASGWLRSEVTRAITRKRAPQLVFRVIPAARGEVQP